MTVRRLLATALAVLCTLSAQAASDSLTVGAFPPDFKAKNAVTGEELRLSAQQGKVVVLTFWASWCGPCRKELPVLENLQRKVGKDKLVVFAVAFQESFEGFKAMKKIARDWQLTLIEDQSERIASQYAIKAIPHLFIIGRDGKVLATHTGYGESSIDELVADINGAFRSASSSEVDSPRQP
jgi:thiol-disulfide isomerase/thioredoxin